MKSKLEGAKILIEMILEGLLQFKGRKDIAFGEIWIFAGETMDQCVRRIKECEKE